jgi:hypothetical protein
MRMLHLACLLMLLATAAPEQAPTTCGSYAAQAGDSQVDLAPLPGFVEICAKDAALCHTLTEGYPPSVKTLGYFVTTDEWERFQKGPRIGFSTYLIAQHATSMRQSEFADFKTYLRCQQGVTPDHTELPRVLESKGRVEFGIFEDGEDVIASGIVMHTATRSPGAVQKVSLAATNAMMVIKGQMFSLYVFVDYSSDADIGRVKGLTHEWVECLRGKNRP